MEGYLSLVGGNITQKVIEKSKFITTSRHVEGEEEARAFISSVAEKYKDATHNCYAYIADSLGNFPRFSDDGEPQDTAGMPMLEAIKNSGLYETAVVVTRYFGGIKLGAGGLVRAYSGAVAENIAGAKKAMYLACSEIVLTIGYPSVDAAQRFISSFGADLKEADYLGDVRLKVAVKKSEETEFKEGLSNALSGKVGFKKIAEYYHPFEI